MDPVTITVMALQAVGSLVKGIGAYQAGKAREKQAKMAAVQANQEAAIEANVALDEADRVGGEAAVRAAANGGGFDGSTADVLADIERRGAFNARSAIWAGSTKANNFLYEGKVARRQGALALLGATVDAGSSVAGGFMQSGEASKQSAARTQLR